MRQALRKIKAQYDFFLFQNRWAEMFVASVIIGGFVWGMWALFRYDTSKEWEYIDSYTGKVTGLRTGGHYHPIVYTLVKLNDGQNVVVYISPEYDVRKNRIVMLDKYMNKKRTTEFEYRFNLEHQTIE